MKWLPHWKFGGQVMVTIGISKKLQWPLPRRFTIVHVHTTWPSTLDPHVKVLCWQLVATSYLNEYAMLWRHQQCPNALWESPNPKACSLATPALTQEKIIGDYFPEVGMRSGLVHKSYS